MAEPKRARGRRAATPDAGGDARTPGANPGDGLNPPDAGDSARQPVPAASATLYEVEWWPVERVIPYDRNPRQIPEEAIVATAASIAEYGWQQHIVVDERNVILAGHTRLLAARRLAMTVVPVRVAAGLSAEQAKAYRLADNKTAQFASWDNQLLGLELTELRGLGFDLALTGFSGPEIADLTSPAIIGEGTGPQAGSLAERFGVPPFSILDARQGYWQARKKAWLALGIQSEIGRGANLLQFSDTVLEPDPQKRAKLTRGGVPSGTTPEFKGAPDNPETVIPNFYAKLKRLGTREAVVKEWLAKAGRAFDAQEWAQQHGNGGAGLAANFSGTSIFDPVLCELCYRWFCPPGGLVLDPCAGGSVRGIVAARLGREYVGIDLSAEQVAANRAQADLILREFDASCKWVKGDSRDLMLHGGKGVPKGQKVDFVFTCPPYGDLERYSDDPLDLSTMEHDAFMAALADMIGGAIDRLKDDRFAAIVIGDIRDPAGLYRRLPAEVAALFSEAGAKLYNDAILITALDSLPIRAAGQFTTSRKLGKAHQNVLIFVKGDSLKATEAVGEIEFGDPEAAGDGEAGQEGAGLPDAAQNGDDQLGGEVGG